MARITAVEGDITREPVDAVVNAANSAMRGGGGVDGAIHRAGGPAILRECIERFPDGLSTGDAGWTTAGALPARWVIHTVGPNRYAGQTDPALLASCFRRVSEVAVELGAATVAVPLVGAGVYGWDADEVARIAVDVFGAAADTVSEYRIVAFGAAAHRSVARALHG